MLGIVRIRGEGVTACDNAFALQLGKTVVVVIVVVVIFAVVIIVEALRPVPPIPIALHWTSLHFGLHASHALHCIALHALHLGTNLGPS